jgi:hypothetical protein
VSKRKSHAAEPMHTARAHTTSSLARSGVRRA